jgi:hypothetical protein
MIHVFHVEPMATYQYCLLLFGFVIWACPQNITSFPLSHHRRIFHHTTGTLVKNINKTQHQQPTMNNDPVDEDARMIRCDTRLERHLVGSHQNLPDPAQGVC